MHVSPAFHPLVGQERAQTRTLNKLMSLWPVQQVILERVLTCSVGTAGGDRGLIDRGLVVGGVVLVSHGGALERVRYDSGTAGLMCEVVMGFARPKRRFNLMGYFDEFFGDTTWRCKWELDRLWREWDHCCFNSCDTAAHHAIGLGHPMPTGTKQ